MKQILCGLIATVMVIGLAGCKSTADKMFDTLQYDSEHTIQGVTYSVPSKWSTSSENEFNPFKDENDGFFLVTASDFEEKIDIKELDDEKISGIEDLMINTFAKTCHFNLSTKSKTEDITGFPSRVATGNMTYNNVTYAVSMNFVFTSSKAYTFISAQEDELCQGFIDATQSVLNTISVDETKEFLPYENFDEYAMDMEFIKTSCDVISHGIYQDDDGKFSWKLSIENVSNMNGLMFFSQMVGALLNPKLQSVALKEEVVKISSVSIEIEGTVLILLLPPISDSGLFVSTIVAQDGYRDKEAIELAYNEYMADFDFGSILSGLSK